MFFQGVLDHCTDSEAAGEQKALVQVRCQALLDSGCDSPYLLGFLVELLQWRLEAGPADEAREALVAQAVGLCARLAQELDKIRARYWNFISDTVTKKYGRAAK